ncbi:MAG: hypothetical protein OXN94_00460 [Chloroflexota bacterium]|nr:hypothetical protein [Chloroflexota bacterium]
MPSDGHSRTVNALATTADGIIYCAAQSGLKRSFDLGRSWRNVGEAAPATVICALDAACILAATVGAVQISEDAGASWQARALPSPSTIVSSLLATSESILAATLEDGVLRSDDDGMSWRGWNFGLLSWRVNALCRDSAGIIWAATESGLFRSETDGRSWQDQADFAQASILSLEATAAGGLCLGTTEGALQICGNPRAGKTLIHQWQVPINAICASGERIAVLHGQTVSVSDGKSGFEALSYTDVTSIKWLDKARLLIGTKDGLVHRIDLP